MTTGEDGGDLVPATNENNDQDYDDLGISEEALQAEEDMHGAKVLIPAISSPRILDIWMMPLCFNNI